MSKVDDSSEQGKPEPGLISRSRVTLKDVAAAMGVHLATVSRAMGDSPLIPAGTRQRVQEAARRMGYERDPMLQALVSYRKASAPVHYHGTIAWMLTDQFRDPAYMNARRDIAEATKAAKPLGYLIEEFRIGEMSPAKLLRQLAARGITGMIFPPQLRPGKRMAIDLSGFAAVRIGETLEVPRLNSVVPNQYGNMMLLLERVREAGWRRIGFYLPRVIDWRTAGAFSAAYWRWQQNQPASEHLDIGLPESYDEAHFVEWFRRVRPKMIVGMPDPYEEWMKRARIRPVPVVLPASLVPDPDEATTHIDENWGAIYVGAVRLLDSMLRHGERGIPEYPRRTVITGRWVPGVWGKGPGLRTG